MKDENQANILIELCLILVLKNHKKHYTGRLFCQLGNKNTRKKNENALTGIQTRDLRVASQTVTTVPWNPDVQTLKL